jgi:simple sugar transport system substrate-binding protein
VAAGGKTIKAAFVYTGPINDHGWTNAHDDGRKALEQALGAGVETAYTENVPETSDSQRVFEDYARKGFDVIYGTSFGFMDYMLEAAKAFPNVKFDHCSGFKTLPNLGTYYAAEEEPRYVSGMIAGKMTKTNTLGFVGSFPIPEVIRNINAFTLGAQSVNPAIKTKVIWVSSWYDPGKERQAAEALVAQGADVMCQNTDSPATVQVAQEKGVYAFGWDTDMERFAPKAHLSANTNNWGVYYTEAAKRALDGKWKPTDTKWGLKENLVVMSPLNKAVPADAARAYEAKKKAITEGTFVPFQGPIKDQSGAIKVAAGAAMPMEQVMGINWYVQGVEGSIPK